MADRQYLKSIKKLQNIPLKSRRNIALAIKESISCVLGSPKDFVLLHRPFFPPKAWDYVKDCLDTGWVSSAGAYVTRFEELLAEKTGCRRVVATVNGTTALEVCLKLAGVCRNDEVLCPSLTFVATANAISHCSAIPHFIDVCPVRFSISASALATRLEEIALVTKNGTINRETGRRIGALCVMHCFGHPAALSDLLTVSSKFQIPLIEDAAESLGSTYQLKHTGRFGLLSATSFNGNKILTTGGGGAVLTEDVELADRARHLTSTAKLPHAYEFRHDEIGWNYRLPNLNAALGLAQLEILEQVVSAKRHLAESYRQHLELIDGIEMMREPGDSVSNYWLNAIILPETGTVDLRNEVLDVLNGSGIQSRPIWVPMHMLEMYNACPRGSLVVSESLYRRVVNIPSSPELCPAWSVS